MTVKILTISLLTIATASCGSQDYKTALTQVHQRVGKLAENGTLNTPVAGPLYDQLPLMEELIKPYDLSREESTKLKCEVIDAFKKNGANLNATDSINRTLLILVTFYPQAFFPEKKDVVMHLIKHGAKPNFASLYEELPESFDEALNYSSLNDLYAQDNPTSENLGILIYAMRWIKKPQQLPVIKTLLSFGCDPNRRIQFGEQYYKHVMAANKDEARKLYKSVLLILDNHRTQCNAMTDGIMSGTGMSRDVCNLTRSYIWTRPLDAPLATALQAYADIEPAKMPEKKEDPASKT